MVSLLIKHFKQQGHIIILLIVLKKSYNFLFIPLNYKYRIMLFHVIHIDNRILVLDEVALVQNYINPL